MTKIQSLAQPLPIDLQKKIVEENRKEVEDLVRRALMGCITVGLSEDATEITHAVEVLVFSSLKTNTVFSRSRWELHSFNPNHPKVVLELRGVLIVRTLDKYVLLKILVTKDGQVQVEVG